VLPETPNAAIGDPFNALNALNHFLISKIFCFSCQLNAMFLFISYKAISLAFFIQILFIYKWHARNLNVSFLAYNDPMVAACVHACMRACE